MDGILILCGIAIAASGPIAFLLALAARGRLADDERRIVRLERELGALASSIVLPSAPPSDEPRAERAAKAAPIAPAPVVEPAAAAPEPPFEPRRSPSAVEGEAVEQRKSRGFEEQLGTRWTVWIGGVALALGGLLLVRYSIEQGYFGPGARCVLGLAFGAALAAAGEFIRRREKASGAVTQTPAILTAAGTVATFGAIYAAHGLYGFIDPTVAFIALGVVALASILAGALHGPSLAGLGLIGASATPLLVTSAQPNPWPAVLYLAVVGVAAHMLARLRRWLWLAAATAGASGLWALVFASENSTEFAVAALVQTLVSTALAAIFVAFFPNAGTKDEDAMLDPAATIIVGGFGVVAALVLWSAASHGYFSAGTMALGGALVAGLAATGAIVAPAAGLVVVAGALALSVLNLWPGADDQPVFRSAAVVFFEPLEPTRFILFAIFGAATTVVFAVRRLDVGRVLPAAPAGLYTLAAAVTPVAILALTYLRLAESQSNMTFAIVAASIAAGFTALAHHFRRGGDAPPPIAPLLALGAFATAAFAALALGLVFALDKGMLTVALALSALAAAAISARLDIAALRWASAAMGLVVLARLIWEPRIVGDDLGMTPILNWLLVGYGVPALAFGLAAHVMRRAGSEDPPVRVAQSLSILFSALLVLFEIRHALRGGDVYGQGSPLLESGLVATSSLMFSFTLTRLDIARASPVFRIASIIFGAYSASVAVFGLAAINPYLSCRAIEGGALFNGLLLAYAAPALAAAFLMRAARGVRPTWFTAGAGALSLVLLFSYACLETRRLFQGADICHSRGQSEVEIWAYSAVWLGLGVLLLIYGIVRRIQGARVASAIFVLAATLKVFLYDLSGLEGLTRALSFIGLGLVLIGIGLAYQKLVFSRPVDRTGGGGLR